jgi:hypothetical protein
MSETKENPEKACGFIGMAINVIKERNYAAAMAVGAIPKPVMPEIFKRITD